MIGVAVQVAVLVLSLTLDEATRSSMWAESGIVESLSALFYLLGFGSACFGSVVSRGPLRWYFAVWAVCCLVFFGEETSWLQHQLGYGTPEAVATANVQREFNLHNLSLLHPTDRSGLSSMISSQNIFRLGFVCFFMVVPLLARTERLGLLLARWRLLYPGLSFLMTTWVPIAASALATLLIADGSTADAVAETRELFYAVAIGSFVARGVQGSSTTSRTNRGAGRGAG